MKRLVDIASVGLRTEKVLRGVRMDNRPRSSSSRRRDSRSCLPGKLYFYALSMAASPMCLHPSYATIQTLQTIARESTHSPFVSFSSVHRAYKLLTTVTPDSVLPRPPICRQSCSHAPSPGCAPRCAVKASLSPCTTLRTLSSAPSYPTRRRCAGLSSRSGPAMCTGRVVQPGAMRSRPCIGCQ